MAIQKKPLSEALLNVYSLIPNATIQKSGLMASLDKLYSNTLICSNTQNPKTQYTKIASINIKGDAGYGWEQSVGCIIVGGSNYGTVLSVNICTCTIHRSNIRASRKNVLGKSVSMGYVKNDSSVDIYAANELFSHIVRVVPLLVENAVFTENVSSATKPEGWVDIEESI